MIFRAVASALAVLLTVPIEASADEPQALPDGLYRLRFVVSQPTPVTSLQGMRDRRVPVGGSTGQFVDRRLMSATTFRDDTGVWAPFVVCRIGGKFQSKVLTEASSQTVRDPAVTGQIDDYRVGTVTGDMFVGVRSFHMTTAGRLPNRDVETDNCTGQSDARAHVRFEWNLATNMANLTSLDVQRQEPDLTPACQGKINVAWIIDRPTTALPMEPLYKGGDVSDDWCAPKPLRPVALNPFWQNPSGTRALDLAAVAREIDAPGSAPGANPSGIALANDVAADGAARVILGARTTNAAAPVTFRLSPNARGGLRMLTSAMFIEPASGVTEIIVQPSQFLPIPGVPGAKAAAVVFVAPEMPADMTGVIMQSITVTQGSLTETIALPLVPPPVLLVHGLWSDSGAWSRWDLQFPAAAAFPYVGKANLPQGLSFADARVQAAFQNELLTALDATRRQGTVAAQIDVVAHSLGGLVARAYRKLHPATASLRSFRQGDIGRLVTIDTPHAGTPLAAALGRHGSSGIGSLAGPKPSSMLIDAWLGRQSLANAMRLMQKPWSGAVASLAPRSTALTWLGSGGGPYDAVAASDADPAGSSAEKALNRVLAAIREPAVDSLLGSRNDVIVALASQGTGSRTLRSFAGLVSSDLGSDAPTAVLNGQPVMDYVGCLLLNRRQCPAAGAAAVRPPIDTFSLTGLRRVAESSLALDRAAPSRGLGLNQPFTFRFRGVGRTLTHVTYLMTGGVDTTMASDANGRDVTVTPVRQTAVAVRAVASFSDRSYAIRTFTLPVAAGAAPAGVFFPQAELRLAGIGSTLQLHPSAYLGLPQTGMIDVTAAASYSVVAPGGTVVQVAPGGKLTARRAGTATVRAVWRGKEARVTVRVVP